MSSYMTVKLKKQGSSVNDSPTIFWTGTTATRELTSELDFIYCDGPDVPWKDYQDSDFFEENFDKSLLTEYDSWSVHDMNYNNKEGNKVTKKMLFVSRFHPLDEKLLDEIIAYYKYNLNILEKLRRKEEKDVQHYEEIALKASNTDVASSFLEQVSEIKQSIDQYEEKIEEVREYYLHWKFIKEILIDANDNSKGNKFEIVYNHD